VLVSDSDGRLTRINPAAERLFGARAAVVGKPIGEVARDPRIAQAVTDVLASQRTVASESAAAVLPWAVDGTRRAFGIRSTPMHDADGRLVGAVTLLEDITHLSEISRMKSEFIAAASHELRTPLTSMQTNIDVLKQQDRLDPAARQRLFDDLQRESHEMRDLIAGLLELARGDDPGLEHTTVQFDELVESSVDRARSRFPQLTFQASLEQTTVEGVPERLERAVWNLLENAGKWSAPQATVEVTLKDGELRVRDHGPGISAEDRPHIFERFYRATAARSLPGSGLGLSIVHDVAEAHGGTVSAEDAPGGGTLMRLTLTNS
jgi:PAS domain S-box-containing protein